MRVVQCLAHEPPLSAAHVARLLVQEAVAANNRLPDSPLAPAEPRDPYSDEDDREQSDDNRHAAAALSVLPTFPVVHGELMTICKQDRGTLCEPMNYAPIPLNALISDISFVQTCMQQHVLLAGCRIVVAYGHTGHQMTHAEPSRVSLGSHPGLPP